MQNKKQKITALHLPRDRARGIALLFAVLLTSMLLLVAIGIADVTYKELIFSSEARNSDKAFFAADTGIECALYFDKHQPPAFSAAIYALGSTESAECNGLRYSVAGASALPIANTGTSAAPIYQFIIPFAGSGQCAEVTVNKQFPDPVSGTDTQIFSNGYNIQGPSTGDACFTGAPGPNVVSRELGTTYKN